MRHFSELSRLGVLCLTATSQVLGQPGSWQSSLKVGEQLHSERRCTEARRVYQEGISIARSAGADLQLAISLHYLGRLEQDCGNLPAAHSRLKEALDIEAGLLGSDDPHLLPLLNDLSSVYFSTGQLSRAEQLLLRSAALSAAVPENRGAESAITMQNLAMLRSAQHRLVEAEDLAGSALAAWRGAGGTEQTPALGAWNTLALVYAATGRINQARDAAAQGVRISRQTESDRSSEAIELTILGAIELGAGRYREADLAFRSARAAPSGGLAPAQHQRLLLDHARTLRALHKRAEARTAEKEARTLWGKSQNKLTVDWSELLLQTTPKPRR